MDERSEQIVGRVSEAQNRLASQAAAVAQTFSEAGNAIVNKVAGVFSLIALYPIVGILLTALAPEGELASFGAPSGIALGNFADAWDQGHFATYLRSSVIVAVSVAIVRP